MQPNNKSTITYDEIAGIYSPKIQRLRTLLSETFLGKPLSKLDDIQNEIKTKGSANLAGIRLIFYKGDALLEEHFQDWALGPSTDLSRIKPENIDILVYNAEITGVKRVSGSSSYLLVPKDGRVTIYHLDMNNNGDHGSVAFKSAATTQADAFVNEFELQNNLIYTLPRGVKLQSYRRFGLKSKF